MELNLVNVVAVPPRADAADPRTDAAQGSASPFEAALQTELEADASAPAASETTEDTAVKTDVLEALATSDPTQAAIVDPALLAAATVPAPVQTPAVLAAEGALAAVVTPPPTASTDPGLPAESLAVDTAPNAAAPAAEPVQTPARPEVKRGLHTGHANALPPQASPQAHEARTQAAADDTRPVPLPRERALERPEVHPAARQPVARDESAGKPVGDEPAALPPARAHDVAPTERAPERIEHALSAGPRYSEPPAAAPPLPASPAAPSLPAMTPSVPTLSQAAPTHTPPAVTAQLTAPFGQTEWADQLRDKVVWLVDRQQHSAELRVHPPHLGPVEVMLTVNDDKTSIAFVAAHPAVREAIESSFSDLRATLEQRGLALDHASVSADSRDAREQLPQQAAASGRRLDTHVAAAEEPRAARLLQYGLVDTFV